MDYIYIYKFNDVHVGLNSFQISVQISLHPNINSITLIYVYWKSEIDRFTCNLQLYFDPLIYFWSFDLWPIYHRMGRPLESTLWPWHLEFPLPSRLTWPWISWTEPKEASFNHRKSTNLLNCLKFFIFSPFRALFRVVLVLYTLIRFNVTTVKSGV